MTASVVHQATADVAKAPHVASVVNPLTPQGASALSKDQSTGYLSVTLSESPGELSVSEAQTIVDAANPAQGGGPGSADRRSTGAEGLQALDRDQ